jgi:hypothetical protein
MIVAENDGWDLANIIKRGKVAKCFTITNFAYGFLRSITFTDNKNVKR